MCKANVLTVVCFKVGIAEGFAEEDEIVVYECDKGI